MAAKSDTPLDDLMMAMDVVDTLRHEEGQVARELKADDRDAAMVERLKQVYASQGIDVPDHILEAGVEDLKRDRFVYSPPSAGFQRTLAMVYISRATWSKWLSGIAAVFVIGILAWYFLLALPQKRAQEALVARLAALPQTFSELVERVDSLTENGDIEADAQRMAEDGRLALADSKNETAFKAEVDLRDLATRLSQIFNVQIVSRENVPTGLKRIPEANKNAENYYIVVEAVSPDGTILEQLIVSEEDGQSKKVDIWGQRVSATIFNAVRQDKLEDGIVQKGILGEKRRGQLDVKWRTGVQDGAITKW
ncbi:MAG: DUF6384 family protein [Roseibium sp.]